MSGTIFIAPLRQPPWWQRLLTPWRRWRFQRKFVPIGFITVDDIRRMEGLEGDDGAAARLS